MDKQIILQKVEFYWNKAKTLFPNLPVDAPSVEFFAEQKRAGYAYRTKHVVGFNTKIAETNSESFEEVISHEIAHIIQFICFPKAKQAHGKEFRSIDTLLGGVGKRFFDAKIDPSLYRNTRYIYTCECKEHFVTSQMHKKLHKAKEINPSAQLKCVKCQQGLLFMNRTTKTK